MMNLEARLHEARTLTGKVGVSSRGRIAAVKIQSVKYIKFKDIQIHEFEREGLTVSDEKLDLEMYRSLLRRVWYGCYTSVLNDDDWVCLFEFELLPVFQLQDVETEEL